MKVFLLFLILVPFTVYSGVPQELSCSNSEICEYFIEGSSCVEDICLCGSDSPLLSADGTKCLSVSAGYGASCSESTQCAAILGSGGTCMQDKNQCQCSIGYHYLKGKCWKSIPLDGSCFMDEQCYSGFDFTGLECKDGKCTCRSEFYQRAGTCRRLNQPTAPCLFDTDCSCGDSEGKCGAGRVCQCPEKVLSHQVIMGDPVQYSGSTQPPCDNGFYEKDGKCVAEIGSACDNNDTCSMGASLAICFDNRACGCDSLRIRTADNRACSKVTVSYNTTCANDEACVSFGINAVCGESGGKKVCQCKENSHFSISKNYCMSDRLIGDICDEDAECFTSSGKYVTCLNHKCSCVSGTHQAENGRDCRPDALLVGDACVSDMDCGFANAMCENSSQQCVCQRSFFPSSPKGDKCLPGVGADCKSDAECIQVAGTFCSIAAPRTCTCQDGSVSSADFSSCLPLKMPGKSCEENSQCDPSMGDLKACKDGICSCQDQAQLIFTRCYLIKRLGEKCNTRAECIYPGEEDKSGNYICQNGVCTCQYGSNRFGDRCV